ncbi:MAG: hypothetical protein MJ252_24215, partial [archaeon]|nr:hypothetical protein [archaeon]
MKSFTKSLNLLKQNKRMETKKNLLSLSKNPEEDKSEMENFENPCDISFGEKEEEKKNQKIKREEINETQEKFSLCFKSYLEFFMLFNKIHQNWDYTLDEERLKKKNLKFDTSIISESEDRKQNMILQEKFYTETINKGELAG